MILSRFRNSSTFFVCLVRFLVNGRAVAVPKNIKTVMIIQTAQMGDMVCTTPVFRAIKQAYPKVRLIVISNQSSLEVLKNNTDVDEIFVKPEFNELVRFIKAQASDYGCLAMPDFSALAALYLAGVPAIVAPDVKTGISTGSTGFYNLLKRFVITVPYHAGRYFAWQYLSLLAPLGIKTDATTKHLGFSAAAQRSVEEFFAQHNIAKGKDRIIGFSASAGNKIKVWPSSKFADVADYLFKQYGAKLLLLGGPKDKAESDGVMAMIAKDTEVINCSEIFNIDELKAVIAKLDLFFSVDTGPIYIAEAFGIPTVDIIGPIDEREQPPIGPRHKIVSLHSSAVKPELTVLNARSYNQLEACRQSKEISATMVIEKIEEIING